jgi:hypothetical protein
MIFKISKVCNRLVSKANIILDLSGDGDAHGCYPHTDDLWNESSGLRSPVRAVNDCEWWILTDWER